MKSSLLEVVWCVPQIPCILTLDTIRGGWTTFPLTLIANIVKVAKLLFTSLKMFFDWTGIGLLSGHYSLPLGYI